MAQKKEELETKKNNNKDNLNNISNEKEQNEKHKCEKCERKEKEFEELIYIKYQTEEKYQEEKLKNNILEKEKENFIKNLTNIKTKNEDLKKQIYFKNSEINQLEEIINNLRNKLNNIKIPSEETLEIKPKNEVGEDLVKKYMNQINFYGKRNCELESKINKLIEENNDLKKSINLLHIELSSRFIIKNMKI